MNGNRVWRIAMVMLAAAAGMTAWGQERIEPVRPTSVIPGVEVPQHGLLGVAGPFTHKNLTVFFLFEQKPRLTTEFITLEEGIKAGLVKVTESANPRVEQLLITNDSERPLFLVSGELVRGGQQDRTVRMSLVIPPKTTEAPLPAFCVEQSRWTGGKGFAAQGDVAGNMTQNALNGAGGGSQREVWNSVSSYKGSLRANAAAVTGKPLEASKTTSMAEELNDKGVQDLIGGYLRAVGEKYVSLPYPVGLAYAVDGKLTGLHVFSSSSLFRQLAIKLVRSAAMDAAAGRVEKTPGDLTVKDLANFIAAAWDGKRSTETPGFGNEIVRYVGSETFTTELYYKKAILHSQVGRQERPRPVPPPPPSPLPPRPIPLPRGDGR